MALHRQTVERWMTLIILTMTNSYSIICPQRFQVEEEEEEEEEE